MFKCHKGIKLPYNKQGLIHFTCLDVINQPEHMQQKILNLCIDAAGDNYRALYEALTDNNRRISEIALKYGTSEKRICDYRKIFYELW